MRLVFKQYYALVVVCFALTVSGCMQLRLLTYPPSFTWIEKGEVKSTMQSMGTNLKTLDMLVADEPELGSHQALIVELLSDIEYSAASLSAKVSANDPDSENLPATNHLLIDEHMDDFLELVYSAKTQAEATPPSYYGVGKLIGGCSGCHRFR